MLRLRLRHLRLRLLLLRLLRIQELRLQLRDVLLEEKIQTLLSLRHFLLRRRGHRMRLLVEVPP
jgi:hypothetical protein